MLRVLGSFIFLVAIVRSNGLPNPPLPEKAQCSNLSDSEKFDCFPDPDPNQEACEARGCCWQSGKNSLKKMGVPTCYFPTNYGGYEYVNVSETENGQVAFLRRTFQSPYPRDVEILRIDVEYQTDYRVRVKISDPSDERYETPYPKLSTNAKNAAVNRKYGVIIDENQVGFRIERDDGTVLFNAQNRGAFIYSDLFLQISALYFGEIYGLGEHRSTLSLDPNWSKFTMFNNGFYPGENMNLYGSHPFYLVMDKNGNSHGVYLHNSNAMEVILQPLPAVTFRTVGGILDFYFFMGPTPSDVIRQYTELIGRPYLPPYWSLGYHLCKYGYGSDAATREVWQRNRDARIPFDVMWNDIDMMIEKNDFTIDPVNYANIFDLVNDIHDAGMRYIVILDPGISGSEPEGTYTPYDDAVKMDILVKDKDGNIFSGRVWNPISTVFPDYTHPNITQYWGKQISDFHDRLPFDSLWIDMNEPSMGVDGSLNGCPDEEELEHPPYVPELVGGKMFTTTMCMTTKHYAGVHYNLHNLFSIYQADATQKALKNVLKKRAFLLSRSTFAGSGAYTGHWSGDDLASWYDLNKSISILLSFSLFGISLMGSDICGFRGNSTASLCNRWTQLGAFYPFARNHNDFGFMDQDPAVWGEDVIDSSRKVLNIRYSLLPYLYTLLYRAHVYGDTVARPLFFEFPNDVNTHRIDTTFLWGSGLFIIPVLEDDAVSVNAYIPAGRWYDWYTGKARDSNGEEVTLDAPFDAMPLLIRGGTVLPIQAPDVTTSLSRKNDFTFIVAPNSNGDASGELFWDDGESQDTIENNQYGILQFNLSGKHFTSKVVQWETQDTPQLESIQILGITENVNKVTLNGEEVEFITNPNNVLTITNIGQPLSTAIDVEWN